MRSGGWSAELEYSIVSRIDDVQVAHRVERKAVGYAQGGSARRREATGRGEISILADGEAAGLADHEIREESIGLAEAKWIQEDQHAAVAGVGDIQIPA